MRVLRQPVRLLVPVVTLVTCAGVPAYANKVVTGANAGYAGTVTSRWTPGTRLADPMVEMDSQCEFNTTATSATTMSVQFSGRTQVTPLDPTRVPTLTFVECEINNFAAGGTNVMARGAVSAGTTATVADSTLLSTGPWPLLPVTVCVRSYTLLGSVEPYLLDNPRACQVPSGGEAPAPEPHLAPTCASAGVTIKSYGSTFSNNAEANVFVPAYEAFCGPGAATVVYNNRLPNGTGTAISGSGSTKCVDYVTTHTPFAGDPYYGHTPFCGSDAPLTNSQWAAANSTGGVVNQIPVAIGAVAVVYNVPAGVTCPNPLVLNSADVSNIFSGAETNWNQIPGCTGNATIQRAVRNSGSGTTWIFKDYLGKRNPDFATFNATNDKAGTAWPNVSGTAPAPVLGNGNPGVASAVNTNPGYIGYVEWSEAQKAIYTFGIARVRTVLQDVTGSGSEWPGVSSGVRSGAANCDDGGQGASLPASTAAPGWDTVSITDGTQGYPICGYTYALLFTYTAAAYSTDVSRRQANAAVDLLLVATQDATQALVPASGYTSVGNKARLAAREGLALTL